MWGNQNILWRGGREVVEEFVAQFYPEETVYVQHFWKQLAAAGDRIHGLRGSGVKEHLDQWRALRFSQGQRLNLITPFAIMTVVAVLQESKLDVAIPSVEKLGCAIRKAAAELGAPAALTKQMEQKMAQLLHDLFQQPGVVRFEESVPQPQEHRQAICINVSKPSTVDGKEILPVTGQPAILLREFVRRLRLHWAHGFVLFEWWCQAPSPDPKRRFAAVVGKLAMALKYAGAETRVRAKKRTGWNSGFWELVVPKHVDIVGEIAEARTLRDKSAELIESGRISEGAGALQQSIEMDPDSVASFLLVARLVRVGGGDCLTRDYLRMAWYRLKRAATNLHDAVTVLTEKAEEKEWRDEWAAVLAILQELEKEHGNVSEAMAIVTEFVDDTRVLSEDDIEFSRLCTFLRRIYEYQGSTFPFQEVLENKTIRYVCRAAHAKVRRIFWRDSKDMEDNEIDTAMQNAVWAMICCKDGRMRRPESYGSLDALKSSWITNLAIASAEEILELVYDIRKEDQRILRDYKTAVKNARRSSTQAYGLGQGIDLGQKWNAGAVDRAMTIQKSMEAIGHRVDIHAYWELFRGRCT